MESYWDMKRRRARTAELVAASALTMPTRQFEQRALDLIESDAMLLRDRLQPGAIRSLDGLRTRFRVVVVTMRRSRGKLAEQLRHLDLYPHFDELVVCPVGRPKALALHDSPLTSNLVGAHWIGDTEVDIEAGRALGVTTWAVLCGIRNAEVLRACHPDNVCENLNAVWDRLGSSNG